MEIAIEWKSKHVVVKIVNDNCCEGLCLRFEFSSECLVYVCYTHRDVYKGQKCDSAVASHRQAPT